MIWYLHLSLKVKDKKRLTGVFLLSSLGILYDESLYHTIIDLGTTRNSTG